jgi:hypothetical protein
MADQFATLPFRDPAEGRDVGRLESLGHNAQDLGPGNN